MDILDINNPLSSSFTDNIIAEKLNLRDSTYKENDGMNTAIQMALLQQELETNKRKLKEYEKNSLDSGKSNTREHFAGGCGCSKNKPTCKCESENYAGSSILDNKKILILLIIILAAFCIVQYFSYKNEMKEMMMILCSLIKKEPVKLPSENVAT